MLPGMTPEPGHIPVAAPSAAKRRRGAEDTEWERILVILAQSVGLLLVYTPQFRKTRQRERGGYVGRRKAQLERHIISGAFPTGRSAGLFVRGGRKRSSLVTTFQQQCQR